MYGYFVHNYIMKTSIVLTIGPEAKQVIAWGPSTTTARILPTRRIRYRSIRNPGEIFEDDRENEDERRFPKVLLSKFMKTTSESNATDPESSWLRRALLPIGFTALLGVSACANQSGANGTMPWYERTPVSATPHR
jgi:hypothetical protein